MHPPERVRAALALHAEGATAVEVARRLRLPRGTVQTWISGSIPRSATRDSCDRCGAATHDYRALPLAYTYLLGLYLGDGSISSHARGVFRLRLFLDAKYPGIVAECATAMAAVMPKNPVHQRLTSDNCVEVSSYAKAWPCLFPQHGAGKKHERDIALEEWQRSHVRRRPELLLRGLIHSDGCRFENTGRGGWRQPRYSFCNLSDDIKTIFCDACDLLGLRWTLAPPKTVYVSRKADVAVLDRFVGPKR